MIYSYRLRFEPDDNGTVRVTSPDFPPLATYGENEPEARRHARDALTTLIANMIEADDPIPAPVEAATEPSITLPLLTSLKIELHRTMKESGVDRAELQRRLGWREDAVNRLFRLSHHTRIQDFDTAFGALGRQIAFETRTEAVTA